LTETVETTANGAILYDRQVISSIDESRFVASNWLHSEPIEGRLGSGGRGNTMFVGNIPRQFVLRHYIRGGLVGKFVKDKYVWSGADNSRPFREWRMLAKMADSGLRVPRPAAARYTRVGPLYTADLITVRVPHVRALSTWIHEQAGGEKFWQDLGAAIFEFHAKGVYHADMNAYNLQIDSAGKLWMLDFDRGKLLAAGAWQQQTLARLHRSLQKIKTRDPALHYDEACWQQLLEGYFTASKSA
jgi:tRNA A-37 threonylcarbamoyl transferase component Bud32